MPIGGGVRAATAQPTRDDASSDVAVFPETVFASESETSRVQLAGSGPRAWVAWCDEQGSWAQRADLVSTRPPIQLTDEAGTCPLEAYSSGSGAAVVVFEEYDDTTDWVRTVRVSPQGVSTIDRVVIPGQVLNDLAAAASPAGAVMAYRVDPEEGDDYPILAVTADPQGHLSAVTRLTPHDANVPRLPVVAIDERGRAVVCWQEAGPEDADGMVPFPTVCRVRGRAAGAFAPPTTAWIARDLGLPVHDLNNTGYADILPQSVTIASDGTIGLLGAGDDVVAAVYRDGRWGPTRVLATEQTVYDRSSTATLIDAAGTLHAAWVAGAPTPGPRALHAAAITPDGDVSVRQLDRFPATRDVAPQLAPTADGGAALLWVPDRRHGGPLKLATTPPGLNEFTEPVDRETRPGRTALDTDVSSAPDRTSIAVAEHLVDAAGNETGTATVSLMPVVAPAAAPGQPVAPPPPRAGPALIIRIEKPAVRHGELSLQIVCRHASHGCTGRVTLTANGQMAVTRRLQMNGTGPMLNQRVRFNGPQARRLLQAANLTVTASARSRGGRIAAARRTFRTRQ